LTTTKDFFSLLARQTQKGGGTIGI